MQPDFSLIGGRYRLDKKIGQGGFSQVYLALDTVLERPVAVKILNSDMTEEKDFLERFGKEARAIATLEHPNILGIYDYGQLGDTAFIIMPYVEGGSVHEKLRREGKFSLPQTGYYLTQAANALDYAHRRNLVHRDVKPHNMMLRTEGDHLLLTDFGISKILSSASAQSRTGIMGTLSYMSPEQLGGNVGRGTDIYALGCVLFQLLTGQLPYTGPTEQVVMGHLILPIPSIVERSQGQLPPAIQVIIEKALAKKVEDRYHSAGEMAQAFQAILNAAPYPVSSQPQPPANWNVNPAQPPLPPFSPPAPGGNNSPNLPPAPVKPNNSPGQYQPNQAPINPSPANPPAYNQAQGSDQPKISPYVQPPDAGQANLGPYDRLNQPQAGPYDPVGSASQSNYSPYVDQPSFLKNPASPSRALRWWLWWVLGSFFGVGITWIVSYVLIVNGFKSQNFIGSIIGGLIGGTVMGMGQGNGLKRIFPVLKRWSLVTIVIWTAVYTFSSNIAIGAGPFSIVGLLSLVGGGLIVGLAQWWLLRRHLVQAYRWVVANLLILPVSILIPYFLINSIFDDFPFDIAIAIFIFINSTLYAGMTTAALSIFSRKHRVN